MGKETILVVDDNKEIVYSISELLKYEGYEVMKAYDGLEALKLASENKIDLILRQIFCPAQKMLRVDRGGGPECHAACADGHKVHTACHTVFLDLAYDPVRLEAMLTNMQAIKNIR